MCIWNVSSDERHCEYCCYGGGCEERESRRAGNVMGKIRSLEIDEWAFFPLSRWVACRTAANKLKQCYGAVFEVHRVDDRIMVERIS